MRVLIVDDDLAYLESLASTLEAAGLSVVTARNFNQARDQLSGVSVDGIVLEIYSQNGDGIKFLEECATRHPDLFVIACTEDPSLSDVVESMKRDALTFLQKPILPERVLEELNSIPSSPSEDPAKGRETRKTSHEKPAGDEAASPPREPGMLLESRDSAMANVLDTVHKAAGTDAGILLLGPSGTGKTVMAKYIHSRSTRSDRPFVTVSCPSLSRELLDSELFGYRKGAFTGAAEDTEGKVHAAEGGTLFLDEIGDLPLQLQPKLLRLLQEQEYERLGDTETRKADIRFISATNQDIHQAVAEGRFREDLLFRLNVISVEMPALKNRPQDLPMLVDWFFKFFQDKHGKPALPLEKEVKQALYAHDWPGNLREMGNVIERAVILSEGETISRDALPDSIWEGESASVEIGAPVPLSEIEAEHIRRILKDCESLEQASKTLGIDSATLYRKRKRMGLL